MGSVCVTFGSIASALFGTIALVATLGDMSHGVTPMAVLILSGLIVSTLITLIGGQLERQEAANEMEIRQAALLKSLWDQSDSIGADHLRVTISTRSRSPHPPPHDLLDAWTLDLRAGRPHDPSLANSWCVRPSLTPFAVTLRAEATSSSRTSDGFHTDTDAHPQHFGEVTFSGFRGDIQALGAASSWNGQSIELHASAPLERESALWEWLREFRFFPRADYVPQIDFGDVGWNLEEGIRSLVIKTVNTFYERGGREKATEVYLAPEAFGMTREWPRTSPSPLPEKIFPRFDEDVAREAARILNPVDGSSTVILPMSVRADMYIANRLVGSSEGIVAIVYASPGTRNPHAGTPHPRAETPPLHPGMRNPHQGTH